jgi:predicted MFS family arabinose efflux permease
VQPRTSWPAVGAALAAGVVAAGFVGKLPPALPALREEFGLSLVAAGWVVSIFNTIAVAAAVAFGVAADRVGALRFAAGAVAALAVGGVSGAVAPSDGWLLASRVVEGAGFLALAVSMPALIFSATAPPDRRLTLGLWSTYMPFGMALSMLAAPLAIASIGWRGLWLAVVAVMLACAGALFLQAKRYPRPPSSGRTLGTIVEALRRPGPWWAAAAMGCYTAQWTAVMVWLPTFLVQTRGVSLGAASLLTAAVVAANVPGNLTGTWLLERHVPRGALIGAAAVAMAATGIAIFADAAPDWLRLGSCFAFSYLSGVTPPATFTSTQTYARSASQVASLQGLIMQVSNLGQLVGPPAVAAVVSATGRWHDAGYVMLAAAAGGLLCGVAVARYERRTGLAPRAPLR